MSAAVVVPASTNTPEKPPPSPPSSIRSSTISSRLPKSSSLSKVLSNSSSYNTSSASSPSPYRGLNATALQCSPAPGTSVSTPSSSSVNDSTLTHASPDNFDKLTPSNHSSSANSQSSITSPNSGCSSKSSFSSVVVKKEPGSPDFQNSQLSSHQLNAAPDGISATRHRPHRLDLVSNSSPLTAVARARASAGVASAKDSPGLLAIRDVGLACLSPGFHTQDPSMREQLERSLDVREQQRQIIVARQKGQIEAAAVAAANSPLPLSNSKNGSSAALASSRSRRRGPPPGLSIVATSPHFKNNEERVVQSAPLHRSFTGLNALNAGITSTLPPPHHNVSRTNGGYTTTSSARASNKNVSMAPVPQTGNRLPPIADFFSAELSGPISLSCVGPRSAMISHPVRSSPPRKPTNLSCSSTSSKTPSATTSTTASTVTATSTGNNGNTSNTSVKYNYATHAYNPTIKSPAISSPSFTSSSSSQPSMRGREYSSADEAVHSLAGGREELLPKIVHYGGSSSGGCGNGGLNIRSRSDVNHQPPLPVSGLPSPASRNDSKSVCGAPISQIVTTSFNGEGSTSGGSSGRRRTREEFERDGGSPVFTQHESIRSRSGPETFRSARNSPESMRQKKEEFIALCSRAWDLFHS